MMLAVQLGEITPFDHADHDGITSIKTTIDDQEIIFGLASCLLMNRYGSAASPHNG